MNILRRMAELEAILAPLTPEQRLLVESLGKIPGAKLTIQTPGTEARLNGVKASDISALVREMDDGYHPTLGEIVEDLGGNPRSQSDKGKVRRVLELVPEIDIDPGRRTVFTKRLTDQRPSADD